MSDFTYIVFLIVATSIGSLLTLFTAGVIGVLVYDSYRQAESSDRAELPRAA